MKCCYIPGAVAAILCTGAVSADAQAQVAEGDGYCEMRYQLMSTVLDPDCENIRIEVVPNGAKALEPAYLRISGLSLESVLLDTATPVLTQSIPRWGTGGGGEGFTEYVRTVFQVDILAVSTRLRLDPDAHFDVYLGARPSHGGLRGASTWVALRLIGDGYAPWAGPTWWPAPLNNYQEHFVGPVQWDIPPLTNFPIDIEIEPEFVMNEHRAIVDYSGVWTGPVESGSGLAIQHVLSENLLTAYWLGYGEEGRSAWLLLGPGVWTSATRYEADLLRGFGTPMGQPHDPSDLAVEPAGSAVLDFSDPVNGVFDFTVDGVRSAIPIRRFLPRPPEEYPEPPAAE